MIISLSRCPISILLYSFAVLTYVPEPLLSLPSYRLLQLVDGLTDGSRSEREKYECLNVIPLYALVNRP
jgi:hypothetical protein